MSKPCSYCKGEHRPENWCEQKREAWRKICPVQNKDGLARGEVSEAKENAMNKKMQQQVDKFKALVREWLGKSSPSDILAYLKALEEEIESPDLWASYRAMFAILGLVAAAGDE